MQNDNKKVSAVRGWLARLVLPPWRLRNLAEQNRNMRHALTEISKRGANPITEYGYGVERPWPRLADDVWEIARNSLKENIEHINEDKIND